MSNPLNANLPTKGDTPAAQRLLTELTEMVRALARSGAFLLRPSVDRVIVPRPEAATALLWGSLNRVLVLNPLAATVQLPSIRPERIGVPLELIVMDATTPLVLVPTGVGANGITRPLINGTDSLTLSAVGLYALKTDGQNWFGG